MPSSTLKIIAIVAMAANHAAYVFADALPASLYIALLGIGGLTFPIMAYLLAEGYRHTSNVRRYMGRLLAFAAVSQVPYGLVLAPGATPLGTEGNVLFALALGLAVMWADDALGQRPLVLAGVVVACLLASLLVNWGPYAVAMSILFKRLHEYRAGDATLDAFVPLLLLIDVAAGIVAVMEHATPFAIGSLVYALVGALGATALLTFYDGTRGLRLKWFFYAFYPGHIVALGLIRLLVF